MRPLPHVLALGALAVALSGCSMGLPTIVTSATATSADPTWADPATPASTPAAVAEESIAAAKQSYLDYTATYADVVFADTSTWDTLLALTIDPYRAELLQALNHFADLGWTHHGTSQLVSLSASAAESAPDSIVLDVCLDSENVSYIDASGVVQPKPPSTIVATTVVMRPAANGDWKVASVATDDGRASECSQH